MKFCIALLCLLASTQAWAEESMKARDDTISVSSSIGVGPSDGASGGQSNVEHPGIVEDLLANESNDGEGVRAVAPQTMSGPASLPHAAVLDTDSDLIGAETDSKFSLSKFKRTFSRLPFDLRFNNRFLNPPTFLAPSGSNLAPQVHHQPPGQMMRRPPPSPHQPRPQYHHQGPPPPQVYHHQAPPMYKSVVSLGPGPHQQQQQLPPQQPKPQQQMSLGSPQAHMIHHVIPQSGPMEEALSSQGGGEMVHTITEYVEGTDDNHRSNDLLNDYDRGTLNTPSNDIWPLSQPDLAKVVHLDVKCEKNFMKVTVEFDRPFNGIIFSKGHFSQANCIHLPAGSSRTHVYFDIRMDSCGTTGNMGSTTLTTYGTAVNAGNFFENTVIFQYDPFVQEAWDQARKLRCTWHDQYEKSVSFRPFPVDMVDVVRADFAGDNVGCWMQIQVGRGPWASEVAGIVKIGQTMTMVLAIKDEENKFDMLVRNCVAHDGKRAPIELVDTNGCIVRSKLMSKFTKIKNFGSSASVLSYAHFQAFKFPDSMEVHFQCTIQICKNSCPEQCDQSGTSNVHYVNHQISGSINTGMLQNHQSIAPEALYMGSDVANMPGGDISRGDSSSSSVLARPREIRDVSRELEKKENQEKSNKTETEGQLATATAPSKEVGLNKVIRVVSTGDLSFATSDRLTQAPIEGDVKSNASNETGFEVASTWLTERINEKICMSSVNFAVCFVSLVALLLFSCISSVVLCCRRRSEESAKTIASAKEAALTGKGGKRSSHHHHDYHGSQTVIPVMAGGGGGGNGYLGSSSVLSPRVQAANGYAMYHN